MPSFTSELEATLHRAIDLADQRRHQYSTIEHLLLALTDDSSAVRLIEGCKGNLSQLRKDATKYLDYQLEEIKLPVERPKLSKSEEIQLKAALERSSRRKSDSEDESMTDSLLKEQASSEQKLSKAVNLALEWEQFLKSGAAPTAGLQRIVQRAILHTQSAGIEEVDGSRVLIAMFSERESYAAYFLKQNGLTRTDVVRFAMNNIERVLGKYQRDTVDIDPKLFPYEGSKYHAVIPDMTSHLDEVSISPTLSTPKVAEKIVDFVSETIIQSNGANPLGNVGSLTVGVYGPWGSGKSTLLYKISDIFRKDGAVVVYINAWKWDGERNIYEFMTEQLLDSLMLSSKFRWKARAIKSILYIRRHGKIFTVTIFCLVLLLILGLFVDWSNVSIKDIVGPNSVVALLGASVIGALAKPAASLAEKILIQPRKGTEPGVELSRAFKYLMLSKKIGDTAGKPIVFVFDDLDRCDPDRVMKFVGSIQNLTTAGAINIIGCDDNIISSSIYKQFREIADLSGEGREFGTKFLEKIVQVHFRMPELSEADLESLGIKPTIANTQSRNIGSSAVKTQRSAYVDVQLVSSDHVETTPTKDVDAVSEDAPSAIALSFICGEVMGNILEVYRLPIRRVKFISNVMKLYTMIFAPNDVQAAFRIITFVGMANVDENWLKNFCDGGMEEAPSETSGHNKIKQFLGENQEALSALYVLSGLKTRTIRRNLSNIPLVM